MHVQHKCFILFCHKLEQKKNADIKKTSSDNKLNTMDNLAINTLQNPSVFCF